MTMTPSITWLGHSTFRFVLADGRVLFVDPWLAENPACPTTLKTVPRCDIVLVTHGHFDHMGEVPALVKQHNPIVVGNYDLCTVLQRMIGGGRFEMMNTGGTISVDGVEITLTQAFHSSAVDTPQGLVYAGMPNGFVFQAPGLASVYHAGDTSVFGDMKLLAEFLAPKICILPIGDRFTMGAAGAAYAAKLLQPTTIIPCHYKTFPILAPNANAFREALSPDLRSKLLAAEVGQELRWTANGASI